MKNQDPKNLFHRFRLLGIAEGISFLVLILIAMPLKYVLQIPEAVKVAGWIHGALFIAFLYVGFEVMGTYKKNLGWFAKAFAAAILPFGTFILDRQLRKEESSL